MSPDNQPVERQSTELAKTKFSSAVSQILDPFNHEGSALFNYLQGVGKRLNISDFDICEVIIEATARGLFQIERKGTEIYNPRAWLSKTCTFVLLDMMKDEKKNRQLKEKNTYSPTLPQALAEIESAEEWAAVGEAFELLSVNDQEIISLRFYQGKKYREIQDHYFETVGVSVKVPTLRKRESRAIARLRTAFLQLYR